MVWIGGVDGCKGGWIMARRRLEGGGVQIVIAPQFGDLPENDITAIDMPIGLPDSGPRGCDKSARRRLGPRRSSVFLGLRRPLLDFDDYAAANAWAKGDGAGLAKQAWNLLSKVRELDEMMTPARQAQIREAHPELAFMALAGAPMKYSKRDPRGFVERRATLLEAGFADLDDWLGAFDDRRAAPDDLLDAYALCHSAARIARDEAIRLPDDPPRDARGLRMEIWY